MEKWDIPQFKFKSLPRNVIRDEWVKYKRNFGYIISATKETDKTRIRDILLAKGGPDLQEVFASIPGADVSEDTEKTIDPYAVGNWTRIFHLNSTIPSNGIGFGF